MKKVWKVNRIEDENAQAAINLMCESMGISLAFAELLYSRGYTDTKSATDFISMSQTTICDPFLMTDMQVAVDRIVKAVRNNENITIYGDYDVDGVTSTCLLFSYIESLDYRGKLGYYIPDRRGEGYGMSVSAIDRIAAHDTNLIITVDTGISAFDEISYAGTLGVDVVVTDHHVCSDRIPSAIAVVNPHRADDTYPFKELAGVGVAFKLITAVEYELNNRSVSMGEVTAKIYREYSDLAALGTIADVMPVTDENRLIISYGLKMMNQSPRPGIKALIEKSGTARGSANVSTSTVCFGIAPRLNAAGRMDKATKALELLLFSNEDVAKDKSCVSLIAETLCDLNTDRQREESRIAEEAFEIIESTCDLKNDKFIVLDSDTWHPGVIGIVSSKIVEKYGLPTILITYADSADNVGDQFDVGRGSGRSVEGINIFDALEYSSDLLVKYGGHSLAAGISVTRGNVDELRRRLCEYVKKTENENTWVSTVSADMELEALNANLKFAEEIKLMEPFGTANSVPVFYMSDVTIVRSNAIGGGKHLKFTLEKNGIALNGVMFSATYEAFDMSVGERVDIMFNLDVNEYNGMRSAQLIIRNIREAESDMKKLALERDVYNRCINGDICSDLPDVVPNRDDFAKVYRYLCNLKSDSISEKRVFLSLDCRYAKTRIIFDIFNEMGLCEVKLMEGNIFTIQINKVNAKIDLNNSKILSDLIRTAG